MSAVRKKAKAARVHSADAETYEGCSLVLRLDVSDADVPFAFTFSGDGRRGVILFGRGCSAPRLAGLGVEGETSCEVPTGFSADFVASVKTLRPELTVSVASAYFSRGESGFGQSSEIATACGLLDRAEAGAVAFEAAPFALPGLAATDLVGFPDVGPVSRPSKACNVATVDGDAVAPLKEAFTSLAPPHDVAMSS